MGVEMTLSFEKVERSGVCEIHGPYTCSMTVINGRERDPFCRECEEIASEKRKREELEQQWRMDVSEAAIPGKFFRAEMQKSEFVPEASAWMARAVSQSSTGPLLIVGPVGTGKTYMAVAMLKHILRTIRWGRYLSAIDYGRRVRETWTTRKEETERSLLDTYSRTGVLVLDELGANRAADDSIIQDLICARYDAGKLATTIVVSNLAPKALTSAIGERAADRIKEGSTVLTLVGESLRKPAA